MEVNESTGQQVNEFFCLTSLTSRTGRTGRTGPMGQRVENSKIRGFEGIRGFEWGVAVGGFSGESGICGLALFAWRAPYVRVPFAWLALCALFLSLWRLPCAGALSACGLALLPWQRLCGLVPSAYGRLLSPFRQPLPRLHACADLPSLLPRALFRHA